MRDQAVAGRRTRQGVFGELRSPGSPGTLRFYDPGRAFGFVALDSGEDAYLSGGAVSASGVDPAALVPGARLRGTVDWSGNPTFEDIETPDGTTAAVPPRKDAESGTGEGEILRWVDERGFGFARVDGAPGDVFVHATVAARSGFEPAPGARCRVTWERQRDRVAALSAEALPKAERGTDAGHGTGDDAVRDGGVEDGGWKEDPLSPLGPVRTAGSAWTGLGFGPQARARGTMAR